DEAAGVNKNFSVPVAAGPNVITVDNNGTDWITIRSYTFTGLGSKADAYVLRSHDQLSAAGWILNKDYNHLAVEQSGVPEAVTGGVLHVEDLGSGLYTVVWYDCLSGEQISTESVFAPNDILELPIPDLYWDLAFVVLADPLS